MFKKLISFFALVFASFTPVAVFAETPYDALVAIADFSGLADTQLTILSVVVTKRWPGLFGQPEAILK